MILRIPTLYLFLIFVVGSIFLMQNPIANELSYREGEEIYLEFSQFWCSAYIENGISKPFWVTNYVHLSLLLILSGTPLIAIFFARRVRIQFVLCLTSMIASAILVASLLIRFRLRISQLGVNLIDSSETPQMLLFGLLFAFQLSLMRFLWPEMRGERFTEN